MPEKNYKIPRGKAATAAKNKYRDKNYDRMELVVPLGMKAATEKAAKESGYSSRNAYIVEAILEKYKNDNGCDMQLEKND